MIEPGSTDIAPPPRLDPADMPTSTSPVAEADQATGAFGPDQPTTAPAGGAVNVAPPEGLRRGRYRLLEAFAQGGLGLVSIAYDEKLRRQVALKEIRYDRQGDDDLRQRFVNEAEITGQLEHPGIVPVYALDEDAEGQPFYAMRFIQGRTLGQAIKEFHGERGRVSAPSEPGDPKSEDHREDKLGALTRTRSPGYDTLAFREFLQRFVTICQTLAYAHSKGVIHRDLKPANVMLGDYGETLVLDWGLAKRLGSDEADRGPLSLAGTFSPTSLGGDNLTEVGQVLGTPAYMSPEQAEAAPLGPTSDIYALGAILYQLLTGQPPYVGNNQIVWQLVRKGPPPRPSELRRRLPAALEAVCLKAMARKTHDRYPTAGELAKDVERWLADEPVQVYREPWTLRARRWFKRRRTLVTSAAAAIVLAIPILLITAALLQAARMNESSAKFQALAAASEARAESARADTNAERARATVEKYFLRVSTNDKLREHGLQPLRKELLDLARQHYENFVAEAGDDPRLQSELGRTYSHLAKITAETGAKSDAIRLNQQAVAIHRKLVEAEPANAVHQRDLANALFGLGTWQKDAAQAGAAQASFTEAVGVFDRLQQVPPNGAKQRMRVANCLDELGLIAFRTGHLKAAEEHFDNALKIAQELASASPADPELRDGLADAYNSLAVFYFQTRRLTDAITVSQHALALREGLAKDSPNDPDYKAQLASATFNLGHTLRLNSQGRDAELAWKRSAELNEELAFAHPFVLAHQRSLGKDFLALGAHYHTTGRPGPAQEHYKKALDIQDRLIRADPQAPGYRYVRADLLNNLGYLQSDNKEYSEAEQTFERLLKALDELIKLEPNVPVYRNRLASAYNNLGLVYRDTDRLDKALATFQHSHRLREELIQKYPAITDYVVDHASSSTNIGVVLRLQGNAAAAVTSLDQAIKKLEEVLQQEPRTAAARQQLGQSTWSRALTLAELGRHPEAMADYDRAITLPGANLVQYRLERAACQARDGDHAAAVASIPEILKEQREHFLIYRAARVYAAASAAVEKSDPALAERYAGKAIERLKELRNGGWYESVGRVKETLKDWQFASLRKRDDFRAIFGAEF